MFLRIPGQKPAGGVALRPAPGEPQPSFLPLRLQPKLTLGPGADPYEREADQVAEQVVSRTLPTPWAPTLRADGSRPPGLGGPSLPPVIGAAVRQTQGSGRPLPQPVRGAMEQAFDADFHLVRVHADGESDRLSRSFAARAFTAGRNIFFRGGEYHPGSRAGQQLLAHELTHVVQQDALGPGAPSSPPVVQRKVGYEVEYAGILLKGKDIQNLPLEKGSVLKLGDGYSLTADELTGGRFDLEIIVHELDEQQSENKRKIGAALFTSLREAAGIETDLGNMSLAERRQGGRLGERYGMHHAKLSKAGDSSKKLQATVGLSLEALSLIRSGSLGDVEKGIEALQEDRGGSEQKEKKEKEGPYINPKMRAKSAVESAMGATTGDVALVRKHVELFARTTGLESRLDQSSLSLDKAIELLSALASLLVEVPIGSRLQGFHYPKAAQGKLLHRTDFAAILKVLPAPVLEHLKDFATSWSLNLLNAVDEALLPDIGRKPFTQPLSEQEYESQSAPSSRRIIGRHSPALVSNWAGEADEQHPEFEGELRLIDWYTSMIREEVDLLTKRSYPGTEKQRVWLESMGGRGDKYDVPEASQELKLPLFEFRGLDPATEPEEIMAQAMAIWDLVRFANSLNPEYKRGRS